MDEFITVNEAAAQAGVEPATVWRWLREGALTRYKTGTGRGRTWIKVSELAGLITPRKDTPTALR